MIKVDNVSKSYRNKHAVIDVSFHVHPGELFVFLGPNGAGKTTTLKMITGLLQQDEGDIIINGMSMRDAPLDVKRIMGYIPDEPFLYEKLTGNEFLDFIIEMFGLVPEEIAEHRAMLTERFEINEFADIVTENYSHGMKQRLLFVAAFVHRPRVVVIDEPMVGLDPYSIRVVKDFLREETERGTTILLSTHTLSVAEECADRILIMHRGQKKECDTLETLKTHYGNTLEDVFMQITRGDENR